MADVTLTYKGSDILELSDSGSATLKTGGKYCEADVEVEYVKPSGGGNYGVWTTSGEVEFTDQHVHTITLPINCPCNTAEIVLRAIKSGTVENGVVTEDEVMTAHLAKNIMFGWTGRAVNYTQLPPLILVKGVSYTNTYSRQVMTHLLNQILYATASRGLAVQNLMGTVPTIIEPSYKFTSLDNGSLIVSTLSYKNTYMFCYEGIYMKFHYDVIAWNE